ncbi:MAG: SDR family oxidoreductase [Pseudonocardiales bacterium]|nr:SDR family oxidoreductase [Pseudonocardiales bacterium]
MGRARAHPHRRAGARPGPHPRQRHPPRRDRDPFIHEPAVGATAAIADFYSPEPFAVPRLGEPADVTRLLLFLASSDASFVTGSEYVIDGGLLLGPVPETAAVA